MTKSVPQALADLGALYEERNKVYKDNYMHFGKILVGLFPRGITLNTEEEFNRFALFVQTVHKQSRYANSILTGGHPDSLDDTTVYSQMLQEYDGLMSDARVKATLDAAASTTTTQSINPNMPTWPDNVIRQPNGSITIVAGDPNEPTPASTGDIDGQA